MDKKNKRRKPKKDQTCYFCDNKSNPDYKDTLVLRRFITDRGRILAAGRTGVCSKHQRKLSKAIKNSRYMSLIVYTEHHAI
jgi:small subunit ribosomal protein S18